MPTSDDVIAEGRKWIGVRWTHQGRGRAGVDCIGLLVVVAQGLSLPHVDRTDYEREPNHHDLLSHLATNLHPVPGNEIFPGAVGVFRERRYPCHVGIFSWKHDRLHLIHARADRRSVVEEPLDTVHMPIVGIFSMPGIAR